MLKPWWCWEGDGGNRDAGQHWAALGSIISMDQFTRVELGSGWVGQTGGKLVKSSIFQAFSSGFHQNRRFAEIAQAFGELLIQTGVYYYCYIPCFHRVCWTS